MTKLTLKVQITFDNVETNEEEFNLSTSGKHNLVITVENKEWLDKYEKENEVEQSILLNEVIGDYVEKYTHFMMELYDFDEEYVQDNVSVAIDEELEKESE